MIQLSIEIKQDMMKSKINYHLISKKCGFKPDEDTIFMPCNGMSGAFLKEHPGEQVISWYK
jgi:translation elongation factor EF-1alpha